MAFETRLFHNLLIEAEQDAANMEQPPQSYDPSQDPNLVPPTYPTGMTPGVADPYGTGGMYGMPGDDSQKLKPVDINQLSRRFELSKIYKRLIELDTILTLVTERPLLDARNYVREAITLFKNMVYNIEIFTDNIDTIIINYYKFLDGTYRYIQEFYKAKNDSDKTENDRRVEKHIQKVSNIQSPNDLTDSSLYY